jgi:hypothetical protein
MELHKIFAHDFTRITGIKVHCLDTDRSAPHWVRLILPCGLNCEQLDSISNFIKETFSVKGRYSHLLVTLGSHCGSLSLTADIKDLERAYKS